MHFVYFEIKEVKAKNKNTPACLAKQIEFLCLSAFLVSTATHFSKTLPKIVTFS